MRPKAKKSVDQRAESLDFADLNQELAAISREIQEIRQRNIVQLGELLMRAKGLMNHGEFGDWCRDSLDISLRTAENYMSVRTYTESFGQSDEIHLLSSFVLYRISSQTTPETARKEILELARKLNASPDRESVYAIIRKHKRFSEPVADEVLPLPSERVTQHIVFPLHKGKTSHNRSSGTLEISFTGVQPLLGEHVVYGLKDFRTGEFFYVGETGDFLARMNQHCNCKRDPSSVKTRKLELSELELPIPVVILDWCSNSIEGKKAENRWIQNYSDTVLNKRGRPRR
jgi:hypothetical protein